MEKTEHIPQSSALSTTIKTGELIHHPGMNMQWAPQREQRKYPPHSAHRARPAHISSGLPEA